MSNQSRIFKVTPHNAEDQKLSGILGRMLDSLAVDYVLDHSFTPEPTDFSDRLRNKGAG